MSNKLSTGVMRMSTFEAEDAPTVSRWTHDARFMRDFDDAHLLVPLGTDALKRKFDAWNERMERREAFHFALRDTRLGRLVGVLRLNRVDWFAQACRIWIGIDPLVQGRGHGREALALAVRYCFDALSLHRIAGDVINDAPWQVPWLVRQGFKVEVRRREAIHWEGGLHDEFTLSLLRPEHEAVRDV